MAREIEVIYGMPTGNGVTVEVDEAIFDLLTRSKRAGETYNDVVRWLLGMPPQAEPGQPMTDPGPRPAAGQADGEPATGRCEVSSWQGTSQRPYGPGGYNRCIRSSGDHHEHLDEWGNRFIVNPDAAGGQHDPRFRRLA